MNKIVTLFSILLITFLSVGCDSTDDPLREPDVNTAETSENVSDPREPTDDFALCKGADISWLTEMEAQGIKFYYDNGTEGDCISILKSKGINSVRLRVWVNPANGYNGLQDVVSKATRAASAGMDVMIDFHYSDTWADPSAQTVPVQWQGKDLDGLCEVVSSHTTEVLTALKENGVTPKWVQVGNETGNGMLWPYGKADTNPAGYARLVNAGYDAVKSVCPDAKVIIHLQNGQDSSLFKWLFDILKDNGARYDVIGMSLYPDKDDYTAMLSKCRDNMVSCIARYGKDVMLCEVGMGNSYVTECTAFLRGCLELQHVITDGHFLGVLYWEPQVYNDWNGYRKGAFTSEGRPGPQLDVFKGDDTSVPVVTI